MKRLAVVVAVLGFAAVVGGLKWLMNASPADAAALAAAMQDPGVTIQVDERFITIRPTQGDARVGLAFYPGMRVAPEAYVPKLAAVAREAGVVVVIGRPTLNLAVLSMNQADELRAAVPQVERWYVGGHSMGGAVACMYASKHADALEGVVLLGTYCGSDLSGSALRVLNVGGERDGLFPPNEISAKRHELPPGAQLVIVPGMNHAQFGDYGPQAGDEAPTIDERAAHDALVNAVTEFLTGARQSASIETAAPIQKTRGTR